MFTNISSAWAEHYFKLVDTFHLKYSCFNITSTTTINRVVGNDTLCFTPDSTLNSSVYSYFILTLALVLFCVSSISLINFALYCAIL